MITPRRQLLAGAAVLALPRIGRAQAPAPITMIVPYAAGGGTDIVGRIFAQAA